MIPAPLGDAEGMVTDGLFTPGTPVVAVEVAVEIERLGVDLELPEDPEDDLPVTPTGDLRVLSGRSNLGAALRRRCKVVPGGLTHRPAYGVGLPLYLEQIGAPAVRAQLSNVARRNILADDRLADAQVSVSSGRPTDRSRSASATISVNARLAGTKASDPPMSVSLTEEL